MKPNPYFNEETKAAVHFDESTGGYTYLNTQTGETMPLADVINQMFIDSQLIKLLEDTIKYAKNTLAKQQQYWACASNSPQVIAA